MGEAAASTASDEQRWATIHATKDKHCAALLAKAGVNYVGVSMKKTAGKDTGIPVIVVAVQNKLPLSGLTDDEVVPPLLDGVATDVVEDALHVRKIAGPGSRKRARSAPRDPSHRAPQPQTQLAQQPALLARPRAFTCLWAGHEADLFAGIAAGSGSLAPQGLHLGGQGNAKQRAHHKLQVGDLYYPLRLHRGALTVVGCLEVIKRVDVRDAGMGTEAVCAWLRERQLKPHGSSCYFPAVLFETRSDKPWVNRVGARAATISEPDALRWVRPDGQERSGRATVASLNSVFRLSEASAQLLDKILVAARIDDS